MLVFFVRIRTLDKTGYSRNLQVAGTPRLHTGLLLPVAKPKWWTTCWGGWLENRLRAVNGHPAISIGARSCVVIGA